MRCGNCDAPLKVETAQTSVTCAYCQVTTRIPAPGQRDRSRAQPPAARMLVVVAVAGVVLVGAIVAFVAQSASRQSVATVPVPTTSGADEERSSREQLAAAESRANEAMALAKAAAAAPTPVAPVIDAGQQPAAPAAKAANKKTANRAPVYAGPVLSKQEAEQALQPEILSCMKQHGVYYLITRLGNERRGGGVPPLTLTGTSVVDYLPAPSFAKTPLGRCVARAGSGVRAPAYRGNYIYFGLRNDSVPDPLADAPARIDGAAAKQALSALDEEARDCAARHPKGSRPGESVRVSVRFQGATGQVASVSPIYVDAKSAYGRCLSSVYRKATIGRFRKIDDKVMHVLAP